MREKDTHTTAPRLPDMMVYVSCSIEEILFGTKIESEFQRVNESRHDSIVLSDIFVCLIKKLLIGVELVLKKRAAKFFLN